MRHRVASGLILLLLFSLAPAFAATPIKVGAYDLPPLVFMEQGKARGFFIDILEYVAAKEGWFLEYHFATWAECLKNLETGKIDLMPNVAINAEREKLLDFTKEDQLLDWASIYARKGSSIHALPDLDGKTVAALRDSIYSLALPELLAQFEASARLEELPDYRSVLLAVDEGRVDAGICTNIAGAQLEQELDVERTGIVFSPVNMHFAVAEGLHPELLRALDRHTKALKASSDSFFYTKRKQWLGSRPEPMIPEWLGWWLGALAILSGVLGIFVLTLRALVVRRTGELRRALDALGLSEQRHRSTFDNAAVGIAHVTPGGRWERVNPTLCAITGYSVEEMLAMTVQDLAPPDETSLYQDAIRRILAGETSCSTFEDRLIRKDGSPVWVILSAAMAYNAAGKPDHFIFVIDDITSRKHVEQHLSASLREKEILLKEIHHRVKNNLQIISSLLFLQSENVTDPAQRAMFTESMNRVMAMAQVHESLYRSDNLAEVDLAQYLNRLTGRLASGHQARGIGCTVRCDPLRLDIDKAVPLGLIVNELIYNAYKHAFIGRESGHIDIRAHTDDSELTLTVQDDGPGLPPNIDPAGRKTLGLELVTALSAQLRGTATFTNDNGLNVAIRFPLASRPCV